MPCMQVQAHGGGIVQVDDTFYWCGESYKQPMLGDFISAGINLYSSTDLQSWHFEGLIFNSSQITDIPAHAPYRVERPKASPSRLQPGQHESARLPDQMLSI